MWLKPLAIDLYCGLGGWAEGFLSEGYDVIGFDVEARSYPGSLALQDVLSLHGSQFKRAACLVASPPCTEYSYMAMHWTRSKQIAGALREEVPFPLDYAGSRTIEDLNALFDACFRIRREASEAAGHYIPLVVENVKGAQPWVGRAKAHFGSFYLWGDVESIGGAIVAGGVRFGNTLRAHGRRKTAPGSWDLTRDNYNPDHSWDGGKSRAGSPGKIWGDRAPDSQWSGTHGLGSKNNGGSWFNVAHNTESGVGNNPDGRATNHDLQYSDGFAGSEAGAEVLRLSRMPLAGSDGGKDNGSGQRSASSRRGHQAAGSGAAWFDKALDERRKQATAIKNGGDWFGSGENCSEQRRHGSRSTARAAASAQIAKIPFELARHIAHVFKPQREEQNGVSESA